MSNHLDQIEEGVRAAFGKTGEYRTDSGFKADCMTAYMTINKMVELGFLKWTDEPTEVPDERIGP